MNSCGKCVLPVELPDDKPDGGDMGQLIKRIEQLEAQKEFLLTVLNKSILLPFFVIDKEEGKEADPWAIAAKEEWAKGLCYCDMEGFAVTEDGRLVLLDECGRFEFCPEGRFEIVHAWDERQIIERIEKAREQSVVIGAEWKAVVTDEDIDEVFGICNPDEEVNHD